MENIYNGILGWYFDLWAYKAALITGTEIVFIVIFYDYQFFSELSFFSPCNSNGCLWGFLHTWGLINKRSVMFRSLIMRHVFLELYLVLENSLIDFLLFGGHTHISTPHVTAFVHPWTVIVRRAICFTLAVHQVRRTWTLLFRFEHLHFRV